MMNRRSNEMRLAERGMNLESGTTGILTTLPSSNLRVAPIGGRHSANPAARAGPGAAPLRIAKETAPIPADCTKQICARMSRAEFDGG